MGNIDSIPVISQTKSLVQVIAGDEAGAKRTQEQFLRTGIVASQLNSLVHSIKGNNREATRIQLEFAKEMETVAESTPVVGHAISAGHAIAGDKQRAEQIAIGATKSTVVMAAGIAGAACGPGAPACGAALATAANAGWDGAETLIAGESRGMVRGIENIIEGNADVGDIFDVVAEQGLVAAGGALGAHGARKAFGRRVKSGKPCKRSVEHFEVFNNNLGEMPGFAAEALPGSIHDLERVRWNDIDQAVNGVFSVFLLIRMFMAGHPKARGYFEEVCQSVYPEMKIQECEERLIQSLEQFDDGDFDPENASSFEDSLNSLVFEMNEMLRNTTVGQGLINAMCFSQNPTKARQENLKALDAQCKSKIESALAQLGEVIQILDSGAAKTRVRRVACGKFQPKYQKPYVESFKFKHVFDDGTFDGYHKKWHLSSQEINQLKNHRQLIKDAGLADAGKNAPSVNTIIKHSDAVNLLDNAHFDPAKGVYFTADPVDAIQVNSMAGWDQGVTRGKAIVKFKADPITGKIFHMEPPLFVGNTY